jgi:SAM-dependent methyltransferase
MNEHTGTSYEGIAHKYAETVDSKAWNAYYERPAVLSLLPPLMDTRVLDAGCGSGWYADYLSKQGARVTAFDLNADFVAYTRQRVGDRARVLQADLTQPLSFAGNEEFDLVVCPLVMHYLKNWPPVFCEFYRVLKPQGTFVFSTHHPFMDWKLFDREDYFALDLLEDEWEIGKVRFYRRPLTAISDALSQGGFLIERLLEPRPTEDFKRVDKANYKKLMKNPWFLVIRACKKA